MQDVLKDETYFATAIENSTRKSDALRKIAREKVLNKFLSYMILKGEKEKKRKSSSLYCSIRLLYNGHQLTCLLLHPDREAGKDPRRFCCR